MPTFRDTRELGIGAVNVNPMEGSQYEYLEFPAVVEIAILADDDDVDAEVFVGSELVAERFQVDERALDEPVEYPEDFLISEVVPAGRKIGIRLSNRNAAEVDVRTVVRINRL